MSTPENAQRDLHQVLRNYHHMVDEAERPEYLFALMFGPLRAQPMLADLMAIVEGWRPHLLICEQGELAGPIAAARHDVPNVTHAFGRLLPEARVARARETMAELWRAHGRRYAP